MALLVESEGADAHTNKQLHLILVKIRQCGRLGEGKVIMNKDEEPIIGILLPVLQLNGRGMIMDYSIYIEIHK